MGIIFTGAIPAITGPIQLEVPTATYSGLSDDTDASVSVNPYTNQGPGENGAGQTTEEIEVSRGVAGIVAAPFSQVQLLLNFDKVINDRSNNSRAFVSNGVTINRTTTKFGGGAGEWDGLSNLEIPHASGVDVWDGSDWTIECYVYITGSQEAGAALFSKATSGSLGSTNGWQILLDGQTVKVNTINGGSEVTYTSSGTVPLNTWTHIAIVKDATSLRVYQEGLETLDVNTAPNSLTNSFDMLIGEDRTMSFEFDGLMDDIRITKGTARYTAAFDPLTTAFATTVDSATDPDFNNVVVLMNFDGAEGSTDFYEETGKTVNTPIGSPVYSSTTTQFGNTSAQFTSAGNGTGIVLNDSPFFTLGTQDFTIECFVNFSSLPGSGAATIVGQYQSGSDSNSSWWLGFSNSSDDLALIIVPGSLQIINSTFNKSTFTLNQWYHLACVREAGTVRFYRDALYGSGGSFAHNAKNVSTDLIIGRDVVGGPEFELDGYLDGIRVTRGVSRYSGTSTSVANFTVPTAPFPTQGT